MRATTSRSPRTEGREPGCGSVPGVEGISTSSSSRSEWVEIGRVERRQRPESLAVRLHGDDPANLLRARRVRLDGDPGQIEYAVWSAQASQPARNGNARVWLSLQLDDPASWRGAAVEIRASDLARLPEGDYYWRDLIGLDCQDETGQPLGRLDEIWATRAHELLVLRAPGRELLVPVRGEVILRVDPEARRITLRLPEGVALESES